MGTKINALFEGTPLQLSDLQNKTLVVDTYNQLYMFLSSIRQGDGGLLKDRKGAITSHLAGLFNRFTRLMKHQIKFVFVFDGAPPELKKKERQRRNSLKQEAVKQFDEARQRQDIAAMKKYAQRTAKLTPSMVEEAKQLIQALGFPIVQAPSEGEAQAAQIVKKGEGFALMSQDADAFLFGAPRVVKNLTITGKRKRAGSYAYTAVPPETFLLNKNLDRLGIDREQLIALALLTGTDYNIGGIKGIGPKKALTLVKKHQHNFTALFHEVAWKKHFDFSWKEAFDLFLHCPVTDDYTLTFSDIDKEKIKELLVDHHEFGRERVANTLAELEANPREDLTRWFSS